MVPGLFRPLKRGDRQRQELHIVHKSKLLTLEFRNSELLGANDLRVLQGILAIASPLEAPEILTGTDTPSHRRELRKNLLLSDTACELKTLVVEGTYYQLAKELGYDETSGKNVTNFRACVKRLCGVLMSVSPKEGSSYTCQLMSQYSSDELKKQLTVALSPRLTDAVLGIRVAASGSHTRIEMVEVRKKMGEDTRIIHQYLCALFRPGEFRTITSETLINKIWPGQSTRETQQKHRERLKIAMNELRDKIGWRCIQIAESRGNSRMKNYRKWAITRPAVPNVLDIEQPPDTKEVPDLDQSPPKAHPQKAPKLLEAVDESDIAALAKSSPAKALRDYGDKLTDEEFAECIRKQPIAALKHCCSRLTDEQFAACIKAAPEACMRYALTRLTADQLAACANRKPESAIRFALVKLTPEQFVASAKATRWPVGNEAVTEDQIDAWFAADPSSALDHTESQTGMKLSTFGEIEKCLSPIRLASCARKWPEAALQNSGKLPETLLTEIVRENPALAIEYAADRIEVDLLDECILVAPAAAIRHRFKHLDKDQRSWCLRKSPWTASALQRSNLTYEERESCKKAIQAVPPHKHKIIIKECPEAGLWFFRDFLTSAQIRECENALRVPSKKPTTSP